MHNVQIINLSLGTTNPDHREAFLAAVDRVKNSGAAIVSAFEMNGRAMLPGSLAGVVAASADRDCPREEYRVDELDSKITQGCQKSAATRIRRGGTGGLYWRGGDPASR